MKIIMNCTFLIVDGIMSFDPFGSIYNFKRSLHEVYKMMS
jgi:hypothetical protein